MALYVEEMAWMIAIVDAMVLRGSIVRLWGHGFVGGLGAVRSAVGEDFSYLW